MEYSENTCIPNVGTAKAYQSSMESNQVIGEPSELAYLAENESIFTMLRKAKRAWQSDVASGKTNLGYAEWYIDYTPNQSTPVTK